MAGSLHDFHHQRGLALIVALVLLLVMTMVAVVAMRSTTLDLKMTTNTTLNRRAFQNSDGSRVSIGPTIESHIFYRGWPNTLTGGTVPGSAKFDLPTELKIKDATKHYYMGENGTLTQILEEDAARKDPDIKFRADVNGDGEVNAEDMFADLWVTRAAALPAAGSGAAQGSGYLGTGVGAAGAGANVYLDLRSTGISAGNAGAKTGAEFRVLVRN